MSEVDIDDKFIIDRNMIGAQLFPGNVGHIRAFVFFNSYDVVVSDSIYQTMVFSVLRWSSSQKMHFQKEAFEYLHEIF